MHVVIMGAGAVGGYFGGVLANQGEQVTLIARGEHLRKIKEKGLLVDSHWGNFRVNVNATDDPINTAPADLIFYSPKLYSNFETLPLISPLVTDKTAILTIQNGISSGSIISEHYDKEKILQGATYIESSVAAPGHISQSGSVAKIEFGEENGSVTKRVEELAKFLKRPGIQIEVSNNIKKTLWTKLVFVASIGTIMAASRSKLSEVFSSPFGYETIKNTMNEILLVGKSQGIEFDIDIVKNFMDAAEKEAEHFQASIQYDLYSGKPLELDDLLGSVVKLAHKEGIPVPSSMALITTLDRFKSGKTT
ncbi:MAG: ketopantoate reductase family protein [Dehalococcoidia bacterium]